MKTFKPFSELTIDATDHDGHAIVMKGKAGPSIIIDATPEDAQRLVDCWNACRKFSNPANHIDATEERVQRLEVLRKEAWATAVELGANDFHAPSVEMEKAS